MATSTKVGGTQIGTSGKVVYVDNVTTANATNVTNPTAVAIATVL